MKQIQFQGKTFKIDREKSIDKNQFVIDFDTLDGWAEAGRLDLLVNNTLNFYKELIQNPQTMEDERFLEELHHYFVHIGKKRGGAGYQKFLDTNIRALQTFKQMAITEKTKTTIPELETQFKALRAELKNSLSHNPNIAQEAKKLLLAFFNEKTRDKLTLKIKEALTKMTGAVSPENRKILTNTRSILQDFSELLSFKRFIAATGTRDKAKIDPAVIFMKILVMAALVVNLAMLVSVYRWVNLNQPIPTFTLVSFVSLELLMYINYNSLKQEINCKQKEAYPAVF